MDTKAPEIKLSTLYGSSATSSAEIKLEVIAKDEASSTFMYAIGDGAKQALPPDGIITATGIEKGKLNIIKVKVYDLGGNEAVQTIKVWGL